MMEDLPANTDQWYVWVFKPGKVDIVLKYIKDKIPEIKQVLCPSVSVKDRRNKKGLKLREVQLYAGYVFLNYNHDPKTPTVWLKLSKHPLVSRYVGPCSDKELSFVVEMTKLLEERDI